MATMSFETDHIESKLDGLALDKQPSHENLGPVHHKPHSSFDNIHASKINDHPVSATTSPKSPKTASPPQQSHSNASNRYTINANQSLQPQYQPKKSLLSSSLAHERQSSGYGGGIPSAGIGIQPINVSPGHTSHFTSSPNSKNHSHQAYFSIDEGLDIQRKYSDDHPEPELLASSVGKEIDGRIVPSSSTISLLSLNNQGNPQLIKVNETSPTLNSVSGFQSSYLPSPKADQNHQQHQPQQHQPQPQQQQQYHAQPQPTAFYHSNQPSYQFQPQSHAIIDRKNSYNNIASRNSITHLNQIRLQPYHKFSSPSPVIQQSQQQQHATFGQQQPASEFISFQTPTQGIPINSKNDGTLIVPDSPNLDPTSLGGSPSRFWLSSQTPPRSLAGSLSRNSRTQLAQMFHQHQMHLQNQHHQNQNQNQNQNQSQNHQFPAHSNSPSAIHITKNTSFNKVDPPHNISISSASVTMHNDKLQQTGGSSPILNPVQTPSEDPPMTPLYLNAHGHASGHGARFEQTGYFDGLTIDTVISKEDEEQEGDKSDDDVDEKPNRDDPNKSGDVLMS